MTRDNLVDVGSLVPGADFTATVPQPVVPIGAVAQWREELRAGVGGQDLLRPATWRRDALWAAACYEQEALAAARAGLSVAAHACMREAARAILEAQRQRQRPEVLVRTA